MSNSDKELKPCLIANVVTKGGTKHFREGAKLFLYPPLWGDGYQQIKVVGRHRGHGGRVVELVINRKHLKNFRAGFVYKKDLYWNNKEEVASMVNSLTTQTEEKE